MHAVTIDASFSGEKIAASAGSWAGVLTREGEENACGAAKT
jgi:hypothetical protein